MKCSACKARLGAYLDADCSARDAEAIARHLASCADCRAEADDLRAVETKLARVTAIEPRRDFTLAVMAKIAVMPAPAQSRLRPWLLLAYVPAAWAAVIALFLTGILNWQGVAAGLPAFAAKFAANAQTLYHVVQHFNIPALAVSGAAFEIALIALAAAAARIYLGRLPSLPWSVRGIGARA